MSEEAAPMGDMKLASARRLLAAAIRLYFDNEDELAVQVLVTAAIGLLRDIEASGKENADPVPSVEGIGNLPLLMLAHSTYIELTDDSIWPEGTVLWVYYNAVEGTKDAVQGELAEFVESLEKLAPGQRLGFCSAWIDKLRSAGASDGGSVH
jgi:hypothetical protein